MPTQPVKSNLPGAELLAGAAGRYALPLMETAPAWNGRVDPAAWRCAAGFDGLSGAAGVDPRRAQA